MQGVPGWLARRLRQSPADGGRDVRERAETSRHGSTRHSSSRHGNELSAVIDAIDEPVLATDGEGVVRLCNRAAEWLLSRDQARVIDRPLDELVTQQDLLELHAAALRGEAGRSQIRITRDDKVRVYEVSAVPLGEVDAAGGWPSPLTRGVVVTLRDVTELATAVQLKTDFVANASHELRTPLTSIRGAIETLREYGVEDAELHARLTQMIAENAGRLEAMLMDLMDLSRLESPDAPLEVSRFSPVEMAQTLTSMHDDACRARDLTLSFDLPAALTCLETDPRLLQMVLKNLIENATKFAYEGTTVLVRAKIVPAQSDQARRDGTQARDSVRFEVVDQGIGIPLAQQQRVFERFFQVDRARSGPPSLRGTGLGLAIVKHATRLMGGRVGLQSVWKEGTTVWVELADCVIPHGTPGPAPEASDEAGPEENGRPEV